MKWRALDRNTPFCIAHQGGTDAAPGNTLAAFEHAVETLGYDFLETDVHLTSDDVLVISHDPEFVSSSGETYSVVGHSWDELKDIDINGHNLIRLVDLVERFSDVTLNIDPKVNEAVKPLASFINGRSIQHRVCIGSFSDKRIRQMRKFVGPSLCLSAGPIAAIAISLMAIFIPVWRPKYGALQIPPSYWGVPLGSAFLIRRLHKVGLQVHYWTINEKAEMARLLRNGADAIITDATADLKQVVSTGSDSR